MAIGLVGLKEGMTQVFKDDGSVTAVTVIKIEPNYITQIKTEDTDGYVAIQIATGAAKKKRVNKARTGHFAKANVPVSKVLTEFRVLSRDKAQGLNLDQYKVGESISIDLFKEGQSVDVTGISKGHGFTGVVVRWGHRTQPRSHGNSLAVRVPGSIGQNQSPGRVMPGKHMPGHYGHEQVTIQNLEIMGIDSENQLILVKGAIPGPSGHYVKILPTVKKKANTAHE